MFTFRWVCRAIARDSHVCASVPGTGVCDVFRKKMAEGRSRGSLDCDLLT